MTSKKTELVSARNDEILMVNPKTLSDAFVGNHTNLNQIRANEIADFLWLPSNLSKEKRNAKILAAIEELAEIKPEEKITLKN